MSDIIQRLATNLREERLKQGLTQAALAEKANLHNNYIGLIERAQCNVSIVTLDSLANALGVGIDKLVGDR